MRDACGLIDDHDAFFTEHEHAAEIITDFRHFLIIVTQQSIDASRREIIGVDERIEYGVFVIVRHAACRRERFVWGHGVTVALHSSGCRSDGEGKHVQPSPKPWKE